MSELSSSPQPHAPGRRTGERCTWDTSSYPAHRSLCRLRCTSPDNLRMSPAVGTEPNDVVAALENALARLAPPVMDTTHVTGQDFRALRTIARTRESWSPEQSGTPEPAATSRGAAPFAWTADAQREARNTEVGVLRVDYWCTSPLSKNITLVVMTAPFGAIENAALSLFDAIIGAASYSSTA